MDSVEIVSDTLVTDEVDLQRAITACLKVVDYKTRFTVSLTKGYDGNSIYELYLFGSGYKDEFGQLIDVSATITVFPISWRADKHDQLPKVPPHFWHMSLKCREKEFLLPFIIALLRENSNYRLWNVEALLMDCDMLSKLYEQRDYNWAYKKE